MYIGREIFNAFTIIIYQNLKWLFLKTISTSVNLGGNIWYMQFITKHLYRFTFFIVISCTGSWLGLATTVDGSAIYIWQQATKDIFIGTHKDNFILINII